MVVGIILILYGLARKRLGLGRMQGNTIRVREIRHLMPKASVALIDVRGKEYLLGISSGNISLLADLGAAPAADPQDFKTILAREQ